MNARSNRTFSVAKQRATHTPPFTTTLKELAENMVNEKYADHGGVVVQSDYWPGNQKGVPSALQKFRLPKDQSEYFIKLPPWIQLEPEKVRKSYVKHWKEAKYDELLRVLEATGFDVADPDSVQTLLVRFITGN